MRSARSPWGSDPNKQPIYNEAKTSEEEFATALVESRFPQQSAVPFKQQRRRTMLWCIALLAILAAATLVWFVLWQEQPQVIGYVEMTRMLDAHDVRKWLVEAGAITIERSDGLRFTATFPAAEAQSLWTALIGSGAAINAPASWLRWQTLLWIVATGAGVLIVITTTWLLSNATPGVPLPISSGKRGVPLIDGDVPATTFADFVGDNAREAMQGAIEFLKESAKFQKLGGVRSPGCHLLVGPAGCGKSLLARAVAGETKVPFFTIAGADLVELYPGVGAARIRDVVDRALRHAPSILFIDEFDSLGRRRSACPDPLAFEQELALSQLLFEVEYLAQAPGVIVLAATNRPDLLDEALLRPGRFDHVVELGMPRGADLEAIVTVHARRLSLSDDVNLAKIAEQIAAKIPDATGATVAKILNDAALRAGHNRHRAIQMQAFLEAIEAHSSSGSIGDWAAHSQGV